MTLNPYSSPSAVPTDEVITISQARPARSLARWTLICTVSAAPSFFWGCGLHRELPHILAMLCGVALFVAAYTTIECSPVFRRLVSHRFVQRTLLIGYGTRLAISVLFPLGLTLDMFVGVFSVALVEDAMLGDALGEGMDYSQASFLAVFLTTVVQGLLLNVVLLAYMGGVYAVQWLIWSVAARQRSSVAVQ